MAGRPESNPRRTSRYLAALALCLPALLIGGCGGASSGAIVHSPSRSRIRDERPPRPKHLDVASRAQEKEARRARRDRRRPEPPPEPPAPAAGGSSIPPASAGTNGSFTPPPPSQRKALSARTVARYESGQASARAILVGGVALAPPQAPEAVQAAVSAANEIVGRPYLWGGGHSSWYAPGYDCSGAVSYALGGGGFLSAPLGSAQFEKWGAPGPGRWITVYANAGHAYAVIAGLRWDTVGDARGSGPRWHAALPYPQGFVARHPPGY